MIKNDDDLRDIKSAASKIIIGGRSFCGPEYCLILIKIPEEHAIAFHQTFIYRSDILSISYRKEL